MIGVKPLFSGRSLGEGENATFDVVVAAPDGTPLARNGLRYELLKVETATSGIAATAPGTSSRSRPPSASPTARSTSPPTSRRASRLPVQWGRYRLEVSTADRNGPVTSVGFDAGWYAEASADTPDLLEIALDKPEYAPGDSMTVAVTARTAGKVTLNVIGDRLITTITQDVRPGIARLRVPVGSDWGTGAYVVATLAPSARRRGRSACRAAPSACSGSRSTARPARSRSILALPHADAAEQRAARAGQDRRACRRRGGAHRRRRGRCRHPQPDQLQAAGARRLLSRPAPAHRRPARPLRPADRRHAGHARPDQDAAATPAAPNCKARRRRRSRSRSIPASSRSSPTAPPRSRSTSRTSPAPRA